MLIQDRVVDSPHECHQLLTRSNFHCSFLTLYIQHANYISLFQFNILSTLPGSTLIGVRKLCLPAPPSLKDHQPPLESTHAILPQHPLVTRDSWATTGTNP